MTNTAELKAAIMRASMTAHMLAVAIGISDQSLSLKINNVREFKQSEIQAICNILKLPPENREKIFFAVNVE